MCFEFICFMIFAGEKYIGDPGVFFPECQGLSPYQQQKLGIIRSYMGMYDCMKCINSSKTGGTCINIANYA